MTGGAHGKQVHIHSRDEVGALAHAFNEMSKACAENMAQMDQDRQQLRAIFQSMVEGVLVLDADQRVQFLNDAAARMLRLTPETATGGKLWQLVRHPQLGSIVEHVLAGPEPVRGELEWRGERRILAVHGARLPGPPLRGAVLVFHDVTHLRKLETVRQDFVANVSHELKTPLAAIQATVETLLDGAMQDTDHNVRFLEQVRDNADRLHRLVQDLLSLGRIESSQAPLELEAIDVQSAVEACIGRHLDRAKAKDLQVVSHPPSHAVIALVDEEALAVILDNLFDNAIKYTPGGGTITLRCFAEDRQAFVQVMDTGVGIPDKDLPRIFERFYRVDKARSRELGGTGLGLSIVKHLVHSLGASITVTSQVGQGSVFTIRIPRTTL